MSGTEDETDTHQAAPAQDQAALPPLAALFLIKFDLKVGCVSRCRSQTSWALRSRAADTQSHGSALFQMVRLALVNWEWFRIDECAVQLDGVVEFKSLPSGLHNVKDDLV